MANKNKQRMDPTISAAVIGAAATVVVGLISLLGMWLQRSPAPTSVTLPPVNEPLMSTSLPAPSATAVPTSVPEYTATPASELRYKETFDSINSNWSLGNSDYDEYSAVKTITDGKYYRTMQTKDISGGKWATVPIVNAPQNFCLMFDARLFDVSEDASVIVNLRTNEIGTGNGSYYILHLFSAGTGTIDLDKPGAEGTVQIRTFSNGFFWNDKQVHTVKISFQDGELKIFDGQSGKLLEDINFTGSDLLLTDGEIRIGIEILQPNQKTTLELDNIYVYANGCP